MPYSTTKRTLEEARRFHGVACKKYQAKTLGKRRAYMKKYYRANPEWYAEYRKSPERQEYMRQYRTTWKGKNAEYQKAWGLLRSYGITLEQRDEIFARSGGLCAICNTRKATRLDHCHKTGKLRGGLCHKCNAGIGMLNDDKDIAQRAFEYLERHS